MNQKILTNEGYLQNFSWSNFKFTSQAWLCALTDIAPWTTNSCWREFSSKLLLFQTEMIAAQFLWEMCFLEKSYKKMQKKKKKKKRQQQQTNKFWNFWECPLYEIWEYAFDLENLDVLSLRHCFSLAIHVVLDSLNIQKMKVMKCIVGRLVYVVAISCVTPGGGSHIDMVYVYVPAFWGTFSRNLV